jgi:arabinofuranosyltransferase
LLILTRLEAGALAVVIAWNLYRDRRIPKAIWYAPVAGLLLVHFWLNVRLYNSIVSDSSKAKIGQGMSGYWGPWPTAFLHVWHLWPYFEWTPYVLLGVVFFAYRGAHQLKGSLWNRAVLPFLGILFCFYWLLNLPGYHWYYAPFIFLTTMMAVAGIPRGRPQTLVLISVLAVQGVTNCFLVVRLTTGEHEYARVANWLATTTAPNATVAACEIGEIGWLSHRYIFDILGLTTPKNAIYISHRDVNTWLVEDRPDYIVVHKPAWVWEQAAVHNSDYEETSFHSKSIVILHRKDLH